MSEMSLSAVAGLMMLAEQQAGHGCRMIQSAADLRVQAFEAIPVGTRVRWTGGPTPGHEPPEFAKTLGGWAPVDGAPSEETGEWVNEQWQRCNLTIVDPDRPGLVTATDLEQLCDTADIDVTSAQLAWDYFRSRFVLTERPA